MQDLLTALTRAANSTNLARRLMALRVLTRLADLGIV